MNEQFVVLDNFKNEVHIYDASIIPDDIPLEKWLQNKGFNEGVLYSFINNGSIINHTPSTKIVQDIPKTLRCSECGGTNIQVLAWVDANTNEHCSDLYEDRKAWCEDCMQEVDIEEFE